MPGPSSATTNSKAALFLNSVFFQRLQLAGQLFGLLPKPVRVTFASLYAKTVPRFTMKASLRCFRAVDNRHWQPGNTAPSAAAKG